MIVKVFVLWIHDGWKGFGAKDEDNSSGKEGSRSVNRGSFLATHSDPLIRSGDGPKKALQQFECRIRTDESTEVMGKVRTSDDGGTTYSSTGECLQPDSGCPQYDSNRCIQVYSVVVDSHT